MNPIMQCGCVANAMDTHGNPLCVIHAGIHKGYATPMDPQPTIQAGRIAKCSLCGREKPSGVMLPFFEHRPDQPHDAYYCGCRGWD